ncbi:Uncharacterized protein APZ42_028999 [Daphnia magna]|uniref:Uncharacterized protein n=1 Tax=Daphnia magna TaxID=35525 RepID=A0A164Q023_9CRUS|nr:Uncharacterized protein APZ42_028999 [Daphnia magna]
MEQPTRLVRGAIGVGGRGGRGGRGRQVRRVGIEVFGDSGKMMKVRAGRVAVGGNRPIRPIALPTTDEIEVAQTIEGAYRNFSRGSIPEIVEKANLIPTPDDDDKEQGIGLEGLVFSDGKERDGGSKKSNVGERSEENRARSEENGEESEGEREEENKEEIKKKIGRRVKKIGQRVKKMVRRVMIIGIKMKKKMKRKMKKIERSVKKIGRSVKKEMQKLGKRVNIKVKKKTKPSALPFTVRHAFSRTSSDPSTCNLYLEVLKMMYPKKMFKPPMTLRVGTHTSLITLALGLVLVEREIIPAAMASCSSEAASQPVTSSAAVAAVISPTSAFKCVMFLVMQSITWLAGSTHAEAAVKNNQKITEYMVRLVPESVSTALLEDDVGRVIPCLKVYFDDDAWDAEMNLINTMKTLRDTKKLGYFCPHCQKPIQDDENNSVQCNACQHWFH